ncbi:glycoside hydrolase domain-containing protein [Amycolatopsis sp. NPDC051045]|uniref:glycoside hydrolase domain-containing protein n=1 Tax=Amycolatopsis sp. NPDC051045 TaxID=3156922 RepID=UPI00341DCB9D
MADEMVRQAQRFVNTQYGGVQNIPHVDEDGQTGWATMYALTRCLQHELGFYPNELSNNFGVSTMAQLTTSYPKIDDTVSVPIGIIRIIQAALWCKGYPGGEWLDYGLPLGHYSASVRSSVTALKLDAGVDEALWGPAIEPKVFKALLTMDAYVFIGNGTPAVRTVQRWLNATYVHRQNFFIIPCDGNFSREVQKALMLAIQFQAGLSDSQANGVFGPATQGALRANPLSVGSSGRWVELFTAAMICNRRAGVQFSGDFSAALSAEVRDFQSFVRLPVNGSGDYQTWASLLVSTGDPTRRGKAVDCVKTITPARARTLRANGYEIVGRYLSNVPNTDLDKNIKFEELDTIPANGLRLFPIYQTYGDSAGYFRFDQGVTDALAAIGRAKYYGFRPGTRIYFAVDFDALDHEITSLVLPYFRGVYTTMFEYAPQYVVGVYGPRNVCSRVFKAGYTSGSFVSDMSTGYSGNLGYTLPEDWVFDQIATIALGSGDGWIDVDNNIVSGGDPGQVVFDPAPEADDLDEMFTASQKGTLLAELQQYLTSVGIPERGGNFWENIGQIYSTTEAFNQMWAYDALFTELARNLRVRKALIMVPIFWEIRKFGQDDPLADDGVIVYHTFTDIDPTNKWIKRDCSTGLGQIFAESAIRARNYCNQVGDIRAEWRDVTNDEHIWEIWKRLHVDNGFNIATAAHVLIYHANDVALEDQSAPQTIPRPSLDYSELNSRLVLRRYQGTTSTADAHSFVKLGVYRIFEKYAAIARS